MRKKVAAVRHDDVCAVAAGPSGAEGARVEAEQFLALPAHRTFPAADPRVCHDLISNLDAGGSRPERCHLASDFVSHCEREVHAARFQRDLPLAAQIEVAIPDMDVAMAYPGRLNAQQHLCLPIMPSEHSAGGDRRAK